VATRKAIRKHPQDMVGRNIALVHGQEEHLVADLELLGIRYLSRQTDEQAERVRPAHLLLADLVRQPSGRATCLSDCGAADAS
jgi:hypothetical protein